MSKNIEILIVEEDLTQAEHLKHILELHDHPTMIAHNGVQALAVMRSHPPEIVISAVTLPLMDGYELCRVIKRDEQLKHIPLILLTSLSETTDIIHGMECGADGFVTKPYDEKLLISRIEYIVLNRELRVGAGTQTGLEIVLGGQKYSITPDRQQIVDLLISTYEAAVQKNHELLRVEEELNRLNEDLEERVKERTAELAGEIAERCAAEVSLIESEERYRRLVELAPDMIAIHCEGRFVYVNDAGVKLLGAASAEELIGKPILDVIHPDYRELVSSRVRQNQEGRPTPPAEIKYIRLDGQVIDVESSGIPTVYQGKHAGHLIVRDIKERKQAEEKLREGEERLRAVFDASRDGIVVEDDGVIVYVNQSYTRMLGYDELEELIGRHISEFLPPDDAKRMTGYGKARLRGETPPSVYEFKAKRKDGSLLDVEGAVSIATITGKIYIITALREIAERKRTEEALATQQQFLRKVVDANPNCIFIKDKEGRYTLVNQAQAELFGTIAENVVGKTAADFIPHQEDVERIFQEDKEVRATLQSLTIPEESITDLKTGEARWFQTIKMPLLSPDGEKHLILGVATDITERKRIAETLQRSEEHFRSLIENATDIVSIVNADGVRRYISPSVERLLGYRPEELIGQNSFGLVHPEDVPELTALFAEGIKHSSRVVTREFRFRHKDGTWRTLELTGRNLLSDPNVAGIIINSRDITERKLVEKELRESESLKGAILESALDCVIAMDHTGAVTEFNPAAEKVFGYSRAEVIGQELAEMVIPPALRESHRRGMAHYLATDEGPVLGKRIEISAMRADGTEFPVELAIASTRASGQPVFTAYLRDISERKQAEHELAESERRYRLLGEGILHQVWTAQPDGKLDYFNQRTLDYFGRTSEQMKNAKWESVAHPDDVQLCVEQGRRSLQTGKDYEVQFRLRRADGVYRWHLARASAGRDSNGQIVKWFGTNTDIDEQKQTEEALHKSEERLQQSQKMEAIGTLAGGVAHDFNNLLTVILGNITLAFRHLPEHSPAQLRLVEAEKAGNRATVLTRQLLAFSRRQHLERRTINLNDTVGEIIKFLERVIGEDVEVKVKTAPDLSAVFADPAQLEQVLMNLCVNARDAMPRGGTLTIETGNAELDENYCRQYPYVQPGRYVQLKVSDNGTGMDAETQARIFEPFFTTKEVGHGTGLGLSMVYGIVKQHDGHIHVYSEVGHGTTFKIFLPVNEKAVEKEKQAKQEHLPGGTETILVAEDEEALRKLSKDVLETLGYTVLIAKNGEEAVEIFAANRERIDLLLFDVVMPRMGGSEAFEQIHEMGGGDVPLIFMSGYSSETVQSRFVKQHKLINDLGAVVIQKPYSLEGLGRKVREILDQAQQK